LKQIDGGEKYVYGVNSNDDIYTRKVDGSGSWHIPGKLSSPSRKSINASVLLQLTTHHPVELQLSS